MSGPLARDPSPLLADDADGVCRIGADGRLSRACLPRCSSAVRAAFYACRDPSCEDGVVATDSTLAISASSAGSPLSLDCGGCIRRARSLCLARACPQELAARDACSAAGQPGGCAAESAAVNACFRDHQHVYEPCLFLSGETCFTGQ